MTACYKNVEKLQRLFLVVWQTFRRSMQIYWKIGWLWYDSPTGGTANVLLELIFGQKRRGVVFGFFFQVWSPMEQKLVERLLRFLELYENVRRCIQNNEKPSVRWRITPLGGAKKANFLKIGNFERPSHTHRKSQGHQIFSFPKQLGALVVCQV